MVRYGLWGGLVGIVISIILFFTGLLGKIAFIGMTISEMRGWCYELECLSFLIMSMILVVVLVIILGVILGIVYGKIVNLEIEKRNKVIKIILIIFVIVVVIIIGILLFKLMSHKSGLLDEKLLVFEKIKAGGTEVILNGDLEYMGGVFNVTEKDGISPGFLFNPMVGKPSQFDTEIIYLYPHIALIDTSFFSKDTFTIGEVFYIILKNNNGVWRINSLSKTLPSDEACLTATVIKDSDLERSRTDPYLSESYRTSLKNVQKIFLNLSYPGEVEMDARGYALKIMNGIFQMNLLIDNNCIPVMKSLKVVRKDSEVEVINLYTRNVTLNKEDVLYSIPSN